MVREATKEELANMPPTIKWAYDNNVTLVLLPGAKAPSYTSNKNFLKMYPNIQKKDIPHGK